MDELIAQAIEYYEIILKWFQEIFWSVESLAQLGVVIILMLIGYGINYWLSPFMHRALEDKEFYQKTEKFWLALYLPAICWLLVFPAWQIAASLGYPIIILRMATSFISVWFGIRFVQELIESELMSKLIGIIFWFLAILNIFGLLSPFLEFLDATSFSVGGTTVTVLGVITGITTMIVLIWAALFISGIIENSLKLSPDVTPSARVLLSKLARIVFVVMAFLFAISSMGIDLTALAVFGGAIGVGLGFGLQKVVSNFISGVILLLDKSIKPGDVIEVSNTYGKINKLAARYTSVISRDGREHLVPNEDIITQPVTNWTFSNKKVRRNLPVNVAYSTDLEHAMELMLAAADESPRVIKNPAPKVLIKGFGDNGVDLEMRMWIRDSENGVSNIASEVYLKIWHKFNDEGVEFPFPQRDVRIVSESNTTAED